MYKLQRKEEGSLTLVSGALATVDFREAFEGIVYGDEGNISNQI